MAHAALREIVERAVEEARKLPGLNTSGDGEQPREGRAVADHSYEDLLATAILNKVSLRVSLGQRIISRTVFIATSTEGFGRIIRGGWELAPLYFM